jgi:hypothetical protein
VDETPAATLRITRSRETLDIDRSFEPISPYADLVWLPRVGPASLVMWQHLCRHLRRSPDGVTLDVDDLADALGLGQGRGASSPVRRTLGRLERFGAIKAQPAGYAVRARLPFLTGGQLGKVPATARRSHAAIVDRQRHNSRAKAAKAKAGRPATLPSTAPTTAPGPPRSRPQRA